jgi:hypothetical protein
MMGEEKVKKTNERQRRRYKARQELLKTQKKESEIGSDAPLSEPLSDQPVHNETKNGKYKFTYLFYNCFSKCSSIPL